MKINFLELVHGLICTKDEVESLTNFNATKAKNMIELECTLNMIGRDNKHCCHLGAELDYPINGGSGGCLVINPNDYEALKKTTCSNSHPFLCEKIVNGKISIVGSCNKHGR